MDNPGPITVELLVVQMHVRVEKLHPAYCAVLAM
jgi:hypothetical protein